MPSEMAPEQVIAALAPYLSDARKARIEQVLAGRTYTVATVVEGLINHGNISAVMRSAEALGFQPFHIVEEREPFKNSSRTSQGADKWLDIARWESPDDCVAALKAGGYTVVATHLSDTAVPIGTIDFTQRTALVLGNEQRGVSPRMQELADRCCIIPTTGFVQSFNISVAAAVALYHAYQDRMGRQGFHGDLSPNACNALRAQFYRLSVRRAEDLLRQAAVTGHGT